MDAEPPREEPRRPPAGSPRAMYRRATSAIDRGQTRVFRFFWIFLPDTSPSRDWRFQHVMASRFLSDAAQQSLAYGAIVAVVRDGGSAFSAALVGIAALIPPATIGLAGGVISDALPKKMALAIGYFIQAALCFTVPTVLGTGISDVMFLIICVHAIGQISGPAESSVVPLVASREQMASANSLLHFSSAAGTAFGTALLAPLLVRVLGVEPVMYLAGALLLLAASRITELPPSNERVRQIDWDNSGIGWGTALRWLLDNRAVATMILVAVLSGVSNTILQTLAPRYVQSAIGVDPADSVYVFAPSSLGMLAAMAFGPPLIRVIGERVTALLGFALTATALFLLGTLDYASDLVRPVNFLRHLSLIGIDIGDRLATAGFLAIPIGFGVTIVAMAVQTYINRRVPLSHQGRVFAMQSALKNGAAIAPLLTLGAIATVVGVEPILAVMPFVLVALAYGLIQFSFRYAGQRPLTRSEVLESFWDEPQPMHERARRKTPR